jgi:hypothetical protein
VNEFIKLMRKAKRIGEIQKALVALSSDPETSVYELRTLAREALQHAEAIITDIEGRARVTPETAGIVQRGQL